jgi:hypothetical protein
MTRRFRARTARGDGWIRQESTRIDEDDAMPQNLMQRWVDGINGRDLEGVLDLYDENAVLIPTFSNRMLGGPARIRDYFETLCSREGLGISLRDKTLVVQPIADALFSLSGIYCWRFEVDGELLNFEARFSYLIDLAREKPILHHHSSQIPRMLG